MKAGLAIRKPVQTVYLNMASTNVPTGSWTTLLAALSNLVACSAVEIFCPAGSTVQIATGAAGHEVAIPYTIPPGGTSCPIVMEIAAKVRISLQAVDTSITSGYFILNMYG
jgi:hypothetical protein